MNQKVTTASRYLLGIIFTVFGANGLMMIFTGSGFIPMPPPAPEMAVVMGGFFGTKYLMPLVKLIQVVSGLCLLSGKRMTLALTLLGPIVVNILGIHLFLDPAGLPIALVIFVLWGLLVKSRWNHFSPLVNN